MKTQTRIGLAMAGRLEGWKGGSMGGWRAPLRACFRAPILPLLLTLALAVVVPAHASVLGIWNFNAADGGGNVTNSAPGGGLPAVLMEFDPAMLAGTDVMQAGFSVGRADLQTTVQAARSGWATFANVPDNGLLPGVNTPVGTRALAVYSANPGNWVHIPGLASAMVGSSGGSIRTFAIAGWYLLQTQGGGGGMTPTFSTSSGVNGLFRFCQTDARMSMQTGVDRVYVEDVGNGINMYGSYQIPWARREAAAARWFHLAISADGTANTFRMWVNGETVNYPGANPAGPLPWPTGGGMQLVFTPGQQTDGAVIGRWLGGAGAMNRTMGLASLVVLKDETIDQSKARYLYQIGRRGIAFDGNWFSVSTGSVAYATVSPVSAAVVVNQTQQFQAAAYNGDGSLMAPPPAFSWSFGGMAAQGSVSGAGLFTAGMVPGGPYTVTATSAVAQVGASATVTVTPLVASNTVTFRNGLDGYMGARDCWITANDYSGNYGVGPGIPSATCGNPSGYSFLRSRSQSPENAQVLVQFDLQSIPTGATVTDARLTLTTLRANNAAGKTLTVRKVTQAWSTNTACWTYFGGGPPANEATSVMAPELPPNTDGAAYDITTGLVALVQGWVSDPASNYGMLTYPSGPADFDSYGSQSGAAANRPSLMVAYTTGGGSVAPPVIRELTMTNALDLRIAWSGGLRPSCRVQSSSNLVAWTNLVTLPAMGTNMSWVHASAREQAVGYYRVVAE